MGKYIIGILLGLSSLELLEEECSELLHGLFEVVGGNRLHGDRQVNRFIELFLSKIYACLVEGESQESVRQ